MLEYLDLSYSHILAALSGALSIACDNYYRSESAKLKCSDQIARHTLWENRFQ